MKKNESGFGVVETLLVIVILGLVIAAGWYVFDHRQQPAITPTNDRAMTSNKLVPQNKLTKYTNIQSNTIFYYPASWGTAKIDANKSDGSLVVDLHGLVFTFQDTSHPQQISRSFEADAQCQFISSDKSWVPAGTYPPTDCTPDMAVITGVNVYGFTKTAEEAYGYSYSLVLKDGRLLQIFSSIVGHTGAADFPAQAQMDSVKQAIKDATGTFIADNSQLF